MNHDVVDIETGPKFGTAKHTVARIRADAQDIVDAAIAEAISKNFPRGVLVHPNDAMLIRLEVTRTIESYAKKTKEAANKILQQRCNFEPDDYSVGFSDSIACGESFSYHLKVTNGGERLDKTALRNLLIKRGVDPGLVENCLDDASKPSASRKSFSVEQVK